MKKGRKHSAETRRKISLGNKGKHKGPVSIETRKKISLANKGKKRSAETRKNMSIAQKGRKVSAETRLKLSLSAKNRIGKKNSFYGKKHLAETRKKISLAHKGKKLSKEHKKSISKGLLGNTHTLEHTHIKETKRKMSVASKANWKRKEYRAKFRNKKYEHNNQFFRSTWEVKVAKFLDKQGIKWEYESKKCLFNLPNDKTYIIDFYLPEYNKYIEVKGVLSEYDLYKINSAREKLDLVVLRSRELEDLSYSIFSQQNGEELTQTSGWTIYHEI